MSSAFCDLSPKLLQGMLAVNVGFWVACSDAARFHSTVSTIVGLSAASTKGDTAGGGTLLCAVKFSTSRALLSGDTLDITYTLSAADDGV